MRFWGFSLVFHLVLLALLVLGSRHGGGKVPIGPSHDPAVEVVRVPGRLGQREAGGRRARPGRLHSTKNIEIGDLGLRFKFSAGRDDTRPADPRFGLGGGGGDHMMKESRNTSIYQELYRRIDANVTYPWELRREGMEGVVTARLSFSREGLYLKEQSVIENGANNYLRVTVARALRRALSEEFPLTLRKRIHEPFTLECTFRFEFTEGDADSMKAANKLIAGNALFFYRNFHHSRLQWEVGPFSGLLPIPALGISPGWFVDKIAGLLSKKSKADPLQLYRDDPEW